MARPDVVDLFARVHHRWNHPVWPRRRRRAKVIRLHPDYLGAAITEKTEKRRWTAYERQIARDRAEIDQRLAEEQRRIAEKERLAKRAADRERWAENARRREAEAPQRRLARLQKAHPEKTPEEVVEFAAQLDRGRIEAAERATKKWEEQRAKEVARDEAQRAEQIRRRQLAYSIGHDKDGYIVVECRCTWCNWGGNIRPPYTDGLELRCRGCGASAILARARITDLLLPFFTDWDD